MKLLCSIVFAIALPATAAPACAPVRDKAGIIARSKASIAEFRRANPCPATGQPHGKCPGYVIDHITPLCACGADSPENMQWQTNAEAKAKDRLERQQCGQRLAPD